ncbi:uncharacterized protein LOC142420006 isoform X2 [Mycteria americana]|uniref:uncharacterized protein LOC142420006 isoform X2 n=1 Tax=Mycteria americana TaxID=33587 RepID=UPI003F587FC2
MHLRVPAGFPPAAARGASPRVRLRHSDRRMRSAPRPVAQQGGRRPPSAEVAGSSPAWASPEGAGDPRVCPGVPPPRRPASVATPGRAEPSGGAEPTPPVVWQHHRQPPSFLPSFLPAAVPGLGRGGGSHGGRRLSPLQHARPADQSLPVSDLGRQPEVALPAQRPAGGRAPARGQRRPRGEGVLGPQPCLRARPSARHPGHPEWHPLPGQPPRQPAHPAAAGRAVALRVGRQPRLVPLHLGSRPPAPGALPAPRRHPPPRLLLPALLTPPPSPRMVTSRAGDGDVPPGDGDVLAPGMAISLPGG